MIPQEMAVLVRLVRALCPAQKIDEYTPDAWMLVIGDLEFTDAEAAVKTLGRTQPFIAAADIASEIRRVRNVRAAQYTDYADTLPNANPDDTAAYIAAIRANNYRAASQLPARPVRQAIDAQFVRVESAWSRGSLAPLRAIEPPRIEDPEFDNARRVLTDAGPTAAQHWLAAARDQLEANGVRLDHRAVALRAADLATRTSHAKAEGA